MAEGGPPVLIGDTAPKADAAFSVTVVRASGLPKTGFFRSDKRRYYVVLTIGDNVKKTSTSAKTNQPEWNEKFNFRASLNSKLIIEVYAQEGPDRKPQGKQLGKESVRVEMIMPSSPDARNLLTRELVYRADKRFKLDLCVDADAPATDNGHGVGGLSIQAPVEGGSAGDAPCQDNVDGEPAIPEPFHFTGKVLDETSTAVTSRLQPPHALGVSTGLMDKAETTAKTAHTIESTLKPVLDKLEVFCNVMDKVAEVHPYAKMAWTILKGVYTVVQNQFDRDQKILGLFAQMKSLYEIVDDLQRQLNDKISPGIKSPKELLRRISIQTIDCCYLVRSYGSLPFVRRMAKGIFSNVDNRIAEYCAAFVSLKQEFYEKLHVDTQLIVSRVLQVVEGAGDKAILSDMPYKGGASLGDKSKQCLPGTRTGILDGMSVWASTGTSEDGLSVCANTDASKDGAPVWTNADASEDGGSVWTNADASEDGRSVWANTDASEDGVSVWANADAGEDGPKSLFVLAGPAGTGKSAIAHSMTAYFKTLHRLAASFGFKRAQGSDSLTKLFPTIAQDMADFDEDIRKALCAAVGGNKALRTTHDLEEQFDHFILEPLKKIYFSGPVLIVIDALDECGDLNEQEKLARLLASRAKEFPPNLRILITSRAESHIIQKFKGETNVVIRYMDNVDSTLADIRSYVHFRLIDDCKPKLADIDEWHCDKLTEASQGLFQWASVACTQIATWTAGRAPSETYRRLFNSASGVDHVKLLDALYQEVLKRFFDMNDEIVKSRFRTVLGMIFRSFEPLGMVSLVAMCQEYCDVTLILDSLGSLLSIPPNASGDPVRPIHTSFRDFLLDPDRSGDFFVDTGDSHQRLALASLRVMNRELIFNICGLKSSWEKNREVSDLKDRIKKHIPDHLLYSCRFWGKHLQAASSLNPQFIKLFNKFLSEKLLCWLEVISLTESSAIKTFDELDKLKTNHYCTALKGISMDDIQDISNFLDMLEPAISASAPHIYLSALPFASPNSFVANKYLPKLRHTLRICNRSLDWPALHQLLFDRDSKVSDLVFTPIGTCVVATGSGPYIVDATSGSIIHEPPHGIGMCGECGAVAVCASEAAVQVAFAPKSGSQIHIWSPHTGHTRTVSIPCVESRTHQRILSLSFPDTSKLFAGSSNGGIYRVDLPTGEVTILYQSNEPLYYVSFSSDGMLVAHGQTSVQVKVFNTTSRRHTTSKLLECRWCRNFKTGNQFPHPTISPKGTYIVARCRCGVILWDLTTGRLTNAISSRFDLPDNKLERCAEFSPDGRSFAFAGKKNILIWSVAAGGLRLGCTISFGDIYYDAGVAYSADGQYIFAYARNTVRRWDLNTLLFGRHHPDSALSAYISDDGRRIAACSVNVGIMHLWDGQRNGQASRSTSQHGRRC
ncbi:hypothetical protein PHLCEN_2v4350 [Hermanssonia centrifuga]|uniref:C2 domain-containing protein n=1 Tax=Hermanssonia centrifuga TaxID=98765 RepID=A0A2R6PVB9_9APHY|nr:hypothetical protein PHLCEN_2v4350 [Hermanssonia centrifuga]